MKKERVDVMLVAQGLFTSREQAKRSIMAGEVYDDHNERLDKPGEKIGAETLLHLKGHKVPYVSRGGLKLAKALQVFPIEIKDKTVLDIGSSTGGFTDVALKNGATRSYALDVGTNQLVWSLRSDPRVTVMEKTNFRYSKLADFTDGRPNFATIDVSFISLSLILPPLAAILSVGDPVVALIKPQFEAGPENVGKKGIVRDSAVHLAVLEKVQVFANESHFEIKRLTFSPIKGGEGNIEFLAWLQRIPDSQSPEIIDDSHLKQIVDDATTELNAKSD